MLGMASESATEARETARPGTVTPDCPAGYGSGSRVPVDWFGAGRTGPVMRRSASDDRHVHPSDTLRPRVGGFFPAGRRSCWPLLAFRPHFRFAGPSRISDGDFSDCFTGKQFLPPRTVADS